MVTDRRIVSANEGRRLQRHLSHMCAFPRGQEKKEMDQAARRARLQRPRIGTIQNGRGASLDRAVAHDRARRPWHHLRSATGIAKGQAVELEARSSGSPQIVQSSSSSSIARRSTLRLAAPGNARLPGRLPGSDGRRLQKPRDARRTGGGTGVMQDLHACITLREPDCLGLDLHAPIRLENEVLTASKCA